MAAFHPLLLDPANRLLGSATNDVSLYGAQPISVTFSGAPEFTNSETARSDDLLTSGPDTQRDAAPPPSDAHGATVSDTATVPAQAPSALPSSALSAPTGTTVSGMQAPASASEGAAADFGSGSLAPLPPIGGQHAAGHAGSEVATIASPVTSAGFVAAFAAPILPAASDHVSSLLSVADPAIGALVPVTIEVTGDLAGTADLASPVLDTLAHVPDALYETVSTVIPVVDGLTDATAGTVAAAADGLADAAAISGATGEAVDTIVTPLVATEPVVTLAESAGPLVGGAADAADQLVDTLAAPLVADTVAAVGNVAAPVVDTGAAAAPAIDATVGAVSETATPATDLFGGTDPAGGIATLVGLVASADTYDLSHVVTSDPDAAAAGSIVDSLADEVPAVDTLLGGSYHHGSDATDPDHHGLGGLL